MNHLTGKVIVVTGAGGSIGSELCRQLMRKSPSKLVLFDNSELNLFNIDRELNAPNVVPVLGDINQDLDVHRAFAHGVEVVFHTAAYKHVTLCQKNPEAAYRVNVQGTRNLVELAAKSYGVKTFVLLSTDKAVRPSCVMGVTKKLAEIIVRQYGYTVVRLGNVRGSSGSVLPIWKEQIERGEPVTITDPHATRYFISAIKAAEYIIEASTFGEGTFVPDMGPPVRLGSLAIQHGAKNFKVIGLRPGEKLHEELFTGDMKWSSVPGWWSDAA